jgi:uncharacterized protein DUF6745
VTSPAKGRRQRRPNPHAEAEGAIRKAYADIGLKAPLIEWYPNPVEALKASIVRSGMIRDFRLWSRNVNRIPEFGSDAWVSMWGWSRTADRAPLNQAWMGVLPPANNQAWLAAATQIVDDQIAVLREQTGVEISGRERSLAIRRSINRPWTIGVPRRWKGHIVHLYHDKVMISEAPIVGPIYEVTGEGDRQQVRLHNPNGPVIEYADGWSLFAIEGRLVPANLVTDPSQITMRDVVRQPNAEVRRIMIERKGGFDVLIAETKATKLIHEDLDSKGQRRRLWQLPKYRQSENSRYLEVVNSTPEPDGSLKSYYLRVPPTVETTQAAAAWTFGLNAEQYELAAES